MARRARALRATPAVPRPPDREGVSASVVVTPTAAPAGCVTTLDFLCARFAAIPREEWVRRMADGDVTADGVVVHPATPYAASAQLHYFRSRAGEPRIPFVEQIVFQDEHLVVADKPHFLPVVPGGRFVEETLLARLKRRLGIATLAPVHRIDRDTAGLVLFSVHPDERDAYQRLFRERGVDKAYDAIAPFDRMLGLPLTRRSRLETSVAFMQMREVDGEVNADTRIELGEALPAGDGVALARYRLYPATGQKHQLRVHMAALGIPIVNDRIYPVLRADDAAEPDYSRPLQLLARSIVFDDPTTGARRVFESQLRLQV